MPVYDGIPYNHGIKVEPKAEVEKEPFAKRHLFAILATAGTACGVGAGISSVFYFKARDAYIPEVDPAKQTTDRSTITTAFLCTTVLSAATAILIPAAIIVHHKRKNAGTEAVYEIKPYIGDATGIFLCVRF
jgi:hypothetical protein